MVVCGLEVNVLFHYVKWMLHCGKKLNNVKLEWLFYEKVTILTKNFVFAKCEKVVIISWNGQFFTNDRPH